MGIQNCRMVIIDSANLKITLRITRYYSEMRKRLQRFVSIPFYKGHYEGSSMHFLGYSTASIHAGRYTYDAVINEHSILLPILAVMMYVVSRAQYEYRISSSDWDGHMLSCVSKQRKTTLESGRYGQYRKWWCSCRYMSKYLVFSCVGRLLNLTDGAYDTLRSGNNCRVKSIVHYCPIIQYFKKVQADCGLHIF